MSSIKERALDFNKEPKFKTQKRRSRVKTFIHNRFLRTRNDEVARSALQEIKVFFENSEEPATDLSSPESSFS